MTLTLHLANIKLWDKRVQLSNIYKGYITSPWMLFNKKMSTLNLISSLFLVAKCVHVLLCP